jgi:hypothetical protein
MYNVHYGEDFFYVMNSHYNRYVWNGLCLRSFLILKKLL